MDFQKASQIYNANPSFVEEGQEALQKLLARSATDLDFRRQLLENPHAALKAYAGQDFPENIDIVFIENKADATVVLPDPVSPEAELSEEELEAVAGGDLATSAAIITSAVLLTQTIKTIGDDDAWFS